MRDRVVRTILFFDLPSVYSNDRRIYDKFRKYLINEGFLMMQESVYSKLVLNSEQAKFLCDRIRKNAPRNGIIQLLTITEKQYANIEYITGCAKTNIINSEERLIVI